MSEIECLEDAMDEIDNLHTENETLKSELETHRWIPVSERLPEEREDKVPYRSEDVLIHCRGVVRRAFYMTRRKCWTFYHAGEELPITHWKPITLPE